MDQEWPLPACLTHSGLMGLCLESLDWQGRCWQRSGHLKCSLLGAGVTRWGRRGSTVTGQATPLVEGVCQDNDTLNIVKRTKLSVYTLWIFNNIYQFLLVLLKRYLLAKKKYKIFLFCGTVFSWHGVLQKALRVRMSSRRLTKGIHKTLNRLPGIYKKTLSCQVCSRRHQYMECFRRH